MKNDIILVVIVNYILVKLIIVKFLKFKKIKKKIFLSFYIVYGRWN